MLYENELWTRTYFTIYVNINFNPKPLVSPEWVSAGERKAYIMLGALSPVKKLSEMIGADLKQSSWFIHFWLKFPW